VPVSKPLRIVAPNEQPTPEHAWLTLSAEIRRLELRAFELRSERQKLKAEVMRGMRQWCCSDELVTAHLERNQ
jgi:hypothetical protein